MSGKVSSADAVPFATLKKNVDETEQYAVGGVKGTNLVFIYDLKNKRAVCEHRYGFSDLKAYLEAKNPESPLCPLCPMDTDKKALIAQPRVMKDRDGMNAFFYDSLNLPRDFTFPRFLHASMYGKEPHIAEGARWKAKYADIGIQGPFVHQDGKEHMDFEIAYDVWAPHGSVSTDRGKEIATVVLLHGVPVNRTEWYDVAHLLGRFVRVVTVDMLGMGWSSMPLEFKNRKSGKWHWLWKTHARIFAKMFDELFDGRVFFIANDWGAGVAQKHGEMFFKQLQGLGIFSAVMMNSYWVQHIGSLDALFLLPYPSDVFHAETVRFAGVLTSLLETMFHNTAHIHNQYTMATLQAPYVEISYDDVTKNPANTIYHDHAVRVLAEQASNILGLGQLLPYHPTKNPKGMKFTNWHDDGANVLQMHGKNDIMMSEGMVHSFENMTSKMNTEWGKKIDYESKIVAKAGHFMSSDQPEKVASRVLKWIRRTAPNGYRALYRSFWGFTEIARKDEDRKMKMWDLD